MAEQAEWEIELTQIRQLMRNEIAAHGRIRERVLRLQEIYQDGVIDGGHNWEIWACDRFAYNRAWLRRMTNPHPLTLDTVARQQQIDHDRQIERELADDRKRTQAAWDFHRGEIDLDARLSQKAFDGYVKAILKAGASIGDRIPRQPIKKPKSTPTKRLPLEPPPPVAEIMVPLLLERDRIERTARSELGRNYEAMQELVQTRKAGRDNNNKFWTWSEWVAAYVQRSLRDVQRLIKLHKETSQNATSGRVPQGEDGDDSSGGDNIVKLR